MKMNIVMFSKTDLSAKKEVVALVRVPADIVEVEVDMTIIKNLGKVDMKKIITI